jgi:hypothetical protein
VTVEVLDVEAVAKLLRCSLKTVEDRARRGDLPGILWGDGGWVFPAGALAQRLDELALDAARDRATPTRPAAVLHAVEPGRRRGKAPPKLPALPSHSK